jgi:DNA-binding transcriptional LysR family regulator
MKLNLRQIEVFRAIMLSGSISGASKSLFVSQPAVSRQISYTEQRLGMLLFQRIKGRLYPTPEAHRLFEEVGALYQRVEHLNEVAENLAENRIGQLRLSCSANIGQTLMPRAVAIFCKRHPAVGIVLDTLAPADMLQALLSRRVEFGVAYMPLGHPSVQARALYRNRIVAVLPLGHRLASRREIGVCDLMHEPFIGYSGDMPIGQLIQQIFGGEGSKKNQPAPCIEVQQSHVACAMVQAGVGVALVGEISVMEPIWSKVVAVPLAPVFNAPINIFNIELEPLSRLAQEFIAILESINPALSPALLPL